MRLGANGPSIHLPHVVCARKTPLRNVLTFKMRVCRQFHHMLSVCCTHGPRDTDGINPSSMEHSRTNQA